MSDINEASEFTGDEGFNPAIVTGGGATYVVSFTAAQAALVVGVDEAGNPHQTKLDATQFLSLKQHERDVDAGRKADSVISSFYAPLLEGLEDVKAATRPVVDEAFRIVLEEPTAGVPASAGKILVPEEATVILRMIESGDTSRLRWFGDSIQVLAL